MSWADRAASAFWRLVNQRIEHALKEKGIGYSVILLSEIFPAQLAQFQDSFDLFVQIACPRLSIDWGTLFHKPVLNPYELFCWVNQDFSTESELTSLQERLLLG